MAVTSDVISQDLQLLSPSVFKVNVPHLHDFFSHEFSLRMKVKLFQRLFLKILDIHSKSINSLFGLVGQLGCVRIREDLFHEPLSLIIRHIIISRIDLRFQLLGIHQTLWSPVSSGVHSLTESFDVSQHIW
jgi:hypothetical protein